MLREGVGFGVAEDGKPGILVKLVGEDMQIDLTEGAISQLLLRHMLPRFRAVLHGAVVRSGSERGTSPEIQHPAP
jgi:V/A-type H+-transporting ATPase subunit E